MHVARARHNQVSSQAAQREHCQTFEAAETGEARGCCNSDNGDGYIHNTLMQTTRHNGTLPMMGQVPELAP